VRDFATLSFQVVACMLLDLPGGCMYPDVLFSCFQLAVGNDTPAFDFKSIFDVCNPPSK
jgi:hypothetical protein